MNTTGRNIHMGVFECDVCVCVCLRVYVSYVDIK